MEKSKDAADGTDGTAQAYATAAAITMDGDVVTSCYIDAVQANVKFNTKGEITSDLDEAPASKNELGEDYGMKAASGIGKEWYEQAEAFGTFVEGKTAAEITGLAADNTDLLSSVTIGTDAFKTLIAKAANQRTAQTKDGALFLCESGVAGDVSPRRRKCGHSGEIFDRRAEADRCRSPRTGSGYRAKP
jgi:hypothetical protein